MKKNPNSCLLQSNVGLNMKYKNCSPPLIVPLLFLAFRINFHILFNVILPSSSSRQLFSAISDCPQSKTMIFSTLVNPTQIPPNFQVFHPWSFLLHSFSILHPVFVCYILIRSVCLLFHEPRLWIQTKKSIKKNNKLKKYNYVNCQKKSLLYDPINMSWLLKLDCGWSQ